jgi:flavodoxin
MKKLIIYYSHDGNTKFIAESIAKEINADITEIKTR